MLGTSVTGIDLVSDPLFDLGIEPADNSAGARYLLWECPLGDACVDGAPAEAGALFDLGSADQIWVHKASFVEKGRSSLARDV